ncbi:AAA family ATPase [Primorskyibacter aestuariivivens]|uniref:AAA family ATPase n=1 Tax=Primorskyibacter aestuariivivens TaxID=1888912 RepID=UPI002301DFB4|nr:AAA family ATPase [Primorskyibacter aestuariivivens]MDA7428078.1 AAA family ATPase [Primorskyibacter aestuariivivens]
MNSPQFGETHEPPVWFEEFASCQDYADHLVLSGNIRDVFPCQVSGRLEFRDIVNAIAEQLRSRGVTTCLRYDPIGGLCVVGALTEDQNTALRDAGIALGKPEMGLADLAEAQTTLARHPEWGMALVVDYASHLPDAASETWDAFFVRIHTATREIGAGTGSAAQAAPTIWLADAVTDLPEWFVFGNDLLRQIHVGLPSLEDRFLFAGTMSGALEDSAEYDTRTSAGHLQEFALLCDGETLLAMRSIVQVARADQIPLARIRDAVRIYRTGLRRNPWNSKVLFNRVRKARDLLHHRIKGQDVALDQTLDILARSIIGLSGSQSGARLSKPRGVLFLAGPTGVGKTELAKAITELLFGDESACHRFDMSEFMEENSVSRLLGAPPGHPGHERGGELVNAANHRPFSVFLFDEVEKAHPRILDVFLQVLDEGRLTDSRGATAYFSEALIVFTSNIGMSSGSSKTNLGMNVLPSDSHAELQSKISSAIHEHFVSELRRPELLNRIGQNVVVFDFLSTEATQQIFDAMLQRVLDTVRAEQGITIEIPEPVRDRFRGLCTSGYFEGGRGIGNRIERYVINPLSRRIFDDGITVDFRVTEVIIRGEKTDLEIEISS